MRSRATRKQTVQQIQIAGGPVQGSRRPGSIGPGDAISKKCHSRGERRHARRSRLNRNRGKRANAQNATSIEVAFRGPARHWPPRQGVDGGCFHRTDCRLSRPVSLFQGRFMSGYSCWVPAVLWAGLKFVQPLIHHWRLSICNRRTVYTRFSFHQVSRSSGSDLSAFWKVVWTNHSKNHRCVHHRWHRGQ
jgi:hypothetical protein